MAFIYDEPSHTFSEYLIIPCAQSAGSSGQVHEVCPFSN